MVKIIYLEICIQVEMFGGTSTGNTGFSFGGTPAATPATSTGFSFGAPATSQPSTGFGFGGTSAPATSTTSTGFGFGGVNTSAPATSTTCTGFGFGGTSAPATNTTGTGFSFGAAPTTPAPSSGFGFGAAAAPSTSSGFGFGNNAAKPSAFGSTTPSAFGATTTPSAFGSTTGTPSAFGSTTTPSAFGSTVPSAFGSTAPSGFGAAPTTFAADSPAESLKAIKLAYSDPQQSRFKHMFYNVVDPTQRQFYVRPGHISERLWKQAEADNPDPMNCVPTAVIGFKELYERIKTQQGHADKLNTFVEGLKATIATMEKACRSTDAQLEQCREQHVLLFHKLIEVRNQTESILLNSNRCII